MDLNRWVDRTLAIQSIPAPTFGEAERAAFLQAEFKSIGAFDLEQDNLGNLLVKIPGSQAAPTVVSAHLDTVFPAHTDLANRRTRSRLIGPGVGDNAVALAALLELGQDLQALDLAGDVWLVANVGEEGLGNLRGMREIVARFGDHVSAYLVLEGMALGHIYHRALPVRRFRVAVQAEGGHSWIHAGRTSALHELVSMGTKILDIPLPSDPRTTLNIGHVQGGRSINSIAHSAMMEIDLRSESEATLEAVEAELKRVLGDGKSEDALVELTVIGSRPGGDIAADHPLVQAALDSFSKAGERDGYLEFGSTDASIPLSLGIPAVCVGITKGGEAHTTKEYIEIKPMQRGYAAILDLIDRSFGLNGRKIAS